MIFNFSLAEDAPLSSRLAALRMQLEEKRRQFEEEKKSKFKEWNEVYFFLKKYDIVFRHNITHLST